MPLLRVIHRSGALDGREVVLDLPVIRLGRDATCQVLFDEQTERVVSRQHAELRWDGDRLFVVPLPGKLVLLRGLAVLGPMELLPGDVLELAGPGGPSVEVLWERSRQHVVGAGRRQQVDYYSPTVMELPAVLAPEAVPPSIEVAPPLDPGPTDAPPARAGARCDPFSLPDTDVDLPRLEQAPAATGAPEPKSAPALPLGDSAFGGIPKGAADPAYRAHTMLLSPVAPEKLEATDLLPKVNVAPPRLSRRWARPAAIGALVLVLAAGALAGVWWHERAANRRSTMARIARLEAKLGRHAQPPGVSDDDWKAYEQEYAQAQPAPVTPRTRLPKPKRARHEGSAAAGEPKRQSQARAKEQGAAVTAFAAWKGLELGRLESKRRSASTSYLARRRAALEAYEALANPLEKDAGPTEKLLLDAARHLGECDAAMPEAILRGAEAAVARFEHDAQAKNQLVSTLERVKQHRYAPTITAALGDERVPLELLFIPYDESGFDARQVGPATALGVPKGMWQLLPSVAKAHGLDVGAQADQPTADPADEREHYEQESRAAARIMRALYAGPAAGSALLVIASYDHGSGARLAAMKAKAGVKPSDRDPAQVNVWRLAQAGALDATALQEAETALAWVAIVEHPKAFGFAFPPPLEHVALADQ